MGEALYDGKSGRNSRKNTRVLAGLIALNKNAYRQQEQIMFIGCQKQVLLFCRFNYIILGFLNYQIVESYYH
ncbi:hypothetical protein VIGAN_08195500 [Vigna angularis var. angularis]|uniref:Uncharacterized protein n=1 Tax=Vigna angularis var. angularis TaxID=157739 RepID=A0A0S3SR05_PHAAN|nr:hypothetical protein VIGAN_08195500 [Vigna angularis var. angularis]